MIRASLTHVRKDTLYLSWGFLLTFPPTPASFENAPFAYKNIPLYMCSASISPKSGQGAVR